MDLLRLTALFVYTLGAFAYGAVVWLWLRQYGRADWTGLRPRPAPNRPLECVGGALSFVSFAWFVTNVLAELAPLNPALDGLPLTDGFLILAFLFPPLIMHTVYLEVGARSLPAPAGWPLVGMYLACQPLSLWMVLAQQGVVPFPALLLDREGLLIGAAFTVAGIYCMLGLSRAKRPARTRTQELSRRWMLGLFGLLIVMFALVILGNLRLIPFLTLLDLGSRSLPLMFLFVGTYFGNRYEFYDLFVKRGLALIATVAVLTLYFALLLPWLDGFTLGWARPLVYAVDLLPVAISLPWFYGKLARRLDRLWFGRQFTPTEALAHFLSTCYAGATSEQDLVERAEHALRTIFNAPARIELDPARATTSDTLDELVVGIGPVTDPAGVIRLQPRANQTPFFSEDVALVTSLADVLWYLLENMRLQRKKQEQETLATEMSLQASQSNLKALRAQINPHFLFNALNAIAGLIHTDPQRADAAIEQLAEVFRYTLRGSDSDWAVLDQELAFVGSYLEVERARFGPRLSVGVTADEEVRSARVPAMMVQTLVENAVKHGVAANRGAGRIEVRARCDGDRLRIEVADNGPGFAREGSPDPRPDAGGYGLRNVRQRLQGHFGDQAALTVARDTAQEMTVVSIVMPLCADARPVAMATAASQKLTGRTAR